MGNLSMSFHRAQYNLYGSIHSFHCIYSNYFFYTIIYHIIYISYDIFYLFYLLVDFGGSVRVSTIKALQICLAQQYKTSIAGSVLLSYALSCLACYAALSSLLSLAYTARYSSDPCLQDSSNTQHFSNHLLFPPVTHPIGETNHCFVCYPLAVTSAISINAK